MKRTLTLLLTLTLCLGLAACSQSGGTGTAAPQGKAAALHNQETDATLSLGMSKEDVTALLGEGKEEHPTLTIPGQESVAMDAPYTQFSYGEGNNIVTVIYQKDAAAVIRVTSPAAAENFTSNWATQAGVACGSTKEDLLSKQGDGQQRNIGQEASSDPALQGFEVYDYFYTGAGADADAWQDGGVWLQATLSVNDAGSRVYGLYLSALSPDVNLYPTKA